MKIKKAGILTFHQSRNYGAILQAYALQKKMSEICDDVEIIDYQNESIKEVIKLWDRKGNGVKSFIKAFLGFIFRLRKKIAFDKYLKKYINLSDKVNKSNISKLSDNYDVVITGSDQVWNTLLTDNDEVYFLDFVSESKKRVSYAASFGDSCIELNSSERELLTKFDLITLREEAMLNKVQEITTTDVKICCDPTLLMSSNEWINHASKRFVSEKYIFVFVIDECKELMDYATVFAREKGLLLISNKNDFRFFCHPLPNDFLSWVLNAEYVVTNSFHGTVFSILFKKKFISHFYKSSGESKKRIIQLLEIMNLEHRNTRNKSLDIDKVEDWESVERKLADVKDSSWKVIESWVNQ